MTPERTKAARDLLSFYTEAGVDTAVGGIVGSETRVDGSPFAVRRNTPGNGPQAVANSRTMINNPPTLPRQTGVTLQV